MDGQTLGIVGRGDERYLINDSVQTENVFSAGIQTSFRVALRIKPAAVPHPSRRQTVRWISRLAVSAICFSGSFPAGPRQKKILYGPVGKGIHQNIVSYRMVLSTGQNLLF